MKTLFGYIQRLNPWAYIVPAGCKYRAVRMTLFMQRMWVYCDDGWEVLDNPNFRLRPIHKVGANAYKKFYV